VYLYVFPALIHVYFFRTFFVFSFVLNFYKQRLFIVLLSLCCLLSLLSLWLMLLFRAKGVFAPLMPFEWCAGDTGGYVIWLLYPASA